MIEINSTYFPNHFFNNKLNNIQIELDFLIICCQSDFFSSIIAAIAAKLYQIANTCLVVALLVLTQCFCNR